MILNLKKSNLNIVYIIKSMNINKLTKAQLIEHVQQVEETKYDNLKVATGMPYNTDEDWIAYIQKLQDLNAERLVDCENLVKLVEFEKQNFQNFLNNSIK